MTDIRHCTLTTILNSWRISLGFLLSIFSICSWLKWCRRHLVKASCFALSFGKVPLSWPITKPFDSMGILESALVWWTNSEWWQSIYVHLPGFNRAIRTLRFSMRWPLIACLFRWKFSFAIVWVLDCNLESESTLRFAWYGYKLTESLFRHLRLPLVVANDGSRSTFYLSNALNV